MSEKWCVAVVRGKSYSDLKTCFYSDRVDKGRSTVPGGDVSKDSGTGARDGIRAVVRANEDEIVVSIMHSASKESDGRMALQAWRRMATDKSSSSMVQNTDNQHTDRPPRKINIPRNLHVMSFDQ